MEKRILVVDDDVAGLIERIERRARSFDDVSSAAGMLVGSIGPLCVRAKKKLREALSH